MARDGAESGCAQSYAGKSKGASAAKLMRPFKLSHKAFLPLGSISRPQPPLSCCVPRNRAVKPQAFRFNLVRKIVEVV
jgi:hypothetical protein